MKKYIMLVFGLSANLGCATDADRKREIEAHKVQLIMYEYPPCRYRLVGEINTEVERTQNAALQDAKERSVDLGAEYLSIMSMSKYAFDKTSVSGKAFVCE
jgi:hypothetical protein